MLFNKVQITFVTIDLLLILFVMTIELDLSQIAYKWSVKHSDQILISCRSINTPTISNRILDSIAVS